MSFVCVVGGRRAARESAARRAAARHARVRTAPVPAAQWPFQRHVLPDAPPAAGDAMLIPDLHLAFPAGQTSGTRLVLTQSTYQLQRWIDWIGSSGALVVAHARRETLTRAAPEAFARRGPWHVIEMVEIEGEGEDDDEPAHGSSRLHSAFVAGSASDRLQACSAEAERERGNPAVQLAISSVYMELDRLQDAQDAVERALAVAHDWEAVWFEYGKLWLRADDLERAAGTFEEAARLMPTFSAALSNLGAALAETDRPDEAAHALTRALEHDPNGYPILNNLSVLHREQGQLDPAVEAARRVTSIAPTFVFGYYNLAHALFLQGRFDEARDVYEEGHRRDPQKNPVQACRLAVARAACGDPEAAIAALVSAGRAIPPDSRSDVLGETEEILEALLTLPVIDHQGIERVLEVVRRQGQQEP
jgi:tetratricopeptide (TPR) repeat protein